MNGTLVFMKRSFLQFQPRRALQAARILARDPEDLPQVFTIIESLSFDTLARAHARMSETPAGRALLAERPDIVPLLADRDALRRLPAGSLGRAYLAFVEAEGISAQGIRDAAEVGAPAQGDVPAPYDYVQNRFRDTHDLWHAVVGFRGDVAGEIALLAFGLGQVFNPAIALIIGVGLFRTLRYPAVRPLLRASFGRGRDAAFLLAQPWEQMLALPLDEVRRRLGVGTPAAYQEIRPATLRAAA